MQTYFETKDTLTVNAGSIEVGAGSFIQLRIRTKNRTTTKLINDGVEYLIRHEGISPTLDGPVTLVKDTKETEVFVERTIYTLSSKIDKDEYQVIGKVNPLTGGIEILGPSGDAVIVIETSAPDDDDGRADGVIYIQTEV